MEVSRPTHPSAPRHATRPLYLQPTFLGLVFVGGALGTTLRGWLAGLFPAGPGGFPAAIFWINVSGSFLLATLLETLAQRGADDGWRRRLRLAVGTGVLGGYTTYSTYAVDIVLLLRAGQSDVGLGYALASLLLGPIAAIAGIATARSRRLRAGQGRA